MDRDSGSLSQFGASQSRLPRTAARTVAACGAVVALAAILGMASPIGLANSITKSESAIALTGVMAHPDAALVAPDRVVAWTAVTLAVCIFLSRHAQIVIARPALLIADRSRDVSTRLTSRSFLRASRAGGLYGG